MDKIESKKIVGKIPSAPDYCYPNEVLVQAITSLGQNLGSFVCPKSGLEVLRQCNADPRYPIYYAWNYTNNTNESTYSEKPGESHEIEEPSTEMVQLPQSPNLRFEAP